MAQEVVQQISTIRIYQLIELGGKRAARVSAASLGEALAGQDYEVRRVEFIARVASVFTEVLAGQERLRLAEESQQLAQRVVSAVAKRVQAGKVPPIEETRAGVALSTTQIELEQAKRDLAVARKQLALLWGNASPHFSKALGNLESSVTLPPFEALAERILASPVALRAMKNIEQRKALLEVEQTRRIPNLTVQAGVVHHALLGGNTAVAAVILPLPLFDRNQGNIQQAHQRVDKAVDEQAATGLRLRTELTQAYEALSAAQRETGILRDDNTRSKEHSKSSIKATNWAGLASKCWMRSVPYFKTRSVCACAELPAPGNEIERLIAAPIDVASSGVVNPRPLI